MNLSTVNTFKTLQRRNSKLKVLSGAELKKLQKILLEMTKDIDKVCKKYKIEYGLGGGSVLGAVRHKGFIPWDDDVDLDFTREGYEKLCEVFEKELGKKYWFQDMDKMSKLGLGFARIRKKGTVCRAREDVGPSSEEMGVYVDVFVVENTYSFVPMRYIHGWLSMSVGFLTSCKRFYENREMLLGLVSDDDVETKKVFCTKMKIGKFVPFGNAEKWAKRWDKVNSMCKNNKSKYVVVPAGRKHFFGEIYERDKFVEVVRTKFEDTKLPVPVEYDAYLTHMYGDYMELPPEEDREAHVFLELKI